MLMSDLFRLALGAGSCVIPLNWCRSRREDSSFQIGCLWGDRAAKMRRSGGRGAATGRRATRGAAHSGNLSLALVAEPRVGRSQDAPVRGGCQSVRQTSVRQTAVRQTGRATVSGGVGNWIDGVPNGIGLTLEGERRHQRPDGGSPLRSSRLPCAGRERARISLPVGGNSPVLSPEGRPNHSRPQFSGVGCPAS